MAQHTGSSRVDKLQESMSLEEKIGQLLHPFILPHQDEEEVRQRLGGIVPGGIFMMPATRADISRHTRALQQGAKVPIVVSSDLECGPGRMISDATIFPDFMALAAAGKRNLAWMMGRAAAVEGREVGIHWNFAPVIDINRNPQNPITNTRSLGDNPAAIAELATEFIRGMQEHGMAGCAKHFPGDGYDARDQHICTSVNPLSRDDWRRLSGSLFSHVISHDVWSIMIGHISLPSIDPGEGNSLSDAPPATLSSKLTTDLLRGELGFQGMIVSDASFMGGLTSWGPREDIVPRVIEAGCDQLLFCDIRTDFEILMRAARSGRLSPARIDEAVRRVLTFKDRLRLFESTMGNPVPATTREEHAAASRELARSALTIAADRHRALPPKLGKDSKILNFHIRGDATYNVDRVDELMREAGMQVVRVTEQDEWPFTGPDALAGFDAILVHVVYGPSWNTNRIRPAGNYLRDLILGLSFHDPRVIVVSYGTPYLLHEFPRLPSLLNAYSPDVESQQAVVEFLEGRIPAPGKSPVNLELRADWFPSPQ